MNTVDTTARVRGNILKSPAGEVSAVVEVAFELEGRGFTFAMGHEAALQFALALMRMAHKMEVNASTLRRAVEIFGSSDGEELINRLCDGRKEPDEDLDKMSVASDMKM